jgi:hypothetical protein
MGDGATVTSSAAASAASGGSVDFPPTALSHAAGKGKRGGVSGARISPTTSTKYSGGGRGEEEEEEEEDSGSKLWSSKESARLKELVAAAKKNKMAPHWTRISSTLQLEFGTGRTALACKKKFQS